MPLIPSKDRDNPPQNRLLAALPADVLARFQDHLTPVHLALGQVIYEPDEPLSDFFLKLHSLLAT